MMSPKENSTRCTEGRSRLKGICGEQAEVRTQGRVAFPAGLARVNEAAQRLRQTRLQRCCTMWMSRLCCVRFGVNADGQLQESMGLRLKNTRATWRATSGICVNVCIPGVTGLKQYAELICRSQMVAYDR